MDTKGVRRQHIAVTIKGKEFQGFIVPAYSPKTIDLLAPADYSRPDLSDTVMLQKAIIKLFREAFDLDIRTCTEGEWAERITIKGGTLKEWQTFTKLTII